MISLTGKHTATRADDSQSRVIGVSVQPWYAPFHGSSPRLRNPDMLKWISSLPLRWLVVGTTHLRMGNPRPLWNKIDILHHHQWGYPGQPWFRSR